MCQIVRRESQQAFWKLGANLNSFLPMLPAYLEVYDHCENEDGGDEVHEVWQVLPVEGLSEGAHLISASGQQVKQSDDGSLKLSAWGGKKSTATKLNSRFKKMKLLSELSPVCFRHLYLCQC